MSKSWELFCDVGDFGFMKSASYIYILFLSHPKIMIYLYNFKSRDRLTASRVYRIEVGDFVSLKYFHK